MRVDSFLWCIRIFKSRSLASQACKKGHVQVNNQTVKPSRELLTMDNIRIRKEQIWKTIEVIAFPTSRVGAKWVPLYAVDKTTAADTTHLELQQLSAGLRRDPGTGRPTKKERREIEDLFESDSNREEN